MYGQPNNCFNDASIGRIVLCHANYIQLEGGKLHIWLMIPICIVKRKLLLTTYLVNLKIPSSICKTFYLCQKLLSLLFFKKKSCGYHYSGYKACIISHAVQILTVSDPWYGQKRKKSKGARGNSQRLRNTFKQRRNCAANTSGPSTTCWCCRLPSPTEEWRIHA